VLGLKLGLVLRLGAKDADGLRLGFELTDGAGERVGLVSVPLPGIVGGIVMLPLGGNVELEGTDTSTDGAAEVVGESVGS
jgi:hypothetical protein